jgi:hypothetical protein
MKLDQIRSLDKNDLLGLLGLETRRTMVDYLVPGLVVLTVGVAVGAGLGLLLAPRTGKDMREDLSKRIQHAPEVMSNLPRRANEALHRVSDQLTEQFVDGHARS